MTKKVWVPEWELRFGNYCLYSYDEESVSARVSEEILNYIPLPPSKGELWERRDRLRRDKLRPDKLRRDKSRLYQGFAREMGFGVLWFL